jgi:hypothetical protein
MNSYVGAYLKIVFIGFTQGFTKLVCNVNMGAYVGTSLVLKWTQGYIWTWIGWILMVDLIWKWVRSE